MVMVCEVCGNEREAVAGPCPFCGTQSLEPELPIRTIWQKTVNLEAGRPTVEAALHRLREIIDDAKRNRVTILTIIHGYGSSGKGGVIREECRKTLDYLQGNGTIRAYIAGEHFHKRNNQVRSLLQRFPRLRSESNLDRNNRGISLVILSSMYFILPFILYATLPS